MLDSRYKADAMAYDILNAISESIALFFGIAVLGRDPDRS